MTGYRRRLPHVYESELPIFLTWCLRGQHTGGAPFQTGHLTSTEVFLVMDRLLDGANTGPFYLRQPRIAELVAQSLHHNADVLQQYELHAWVIMPNHVHVLITPRIPIPTIAKSVKSFTGREANRILNRTATPFWREESFDRSVRNHREFQRIRAYIENNPVRAGLVHRPEDFRWSSGATWRSALLLRGMIAFDDGA